MYNAMNSRGNDLTPIMYSYPMYSIFFIVVMIICSFFITNLFVGVVISTYNREKEKLGNHFLLTEQ